MPPSFFSPDTTWTGTQILLSEQHCPDGGPSYFGLKRICDVKQRHSDEVGGKNS